MLHSNKRLIFHPWLTKRKWDYYIPSMSNTYTNGATLPVSQLEQGSALRHWSSCSVKTFVLAILVTGGDYSLESAEVLSTNGSSMCRLPKLSQYKTGHTQSGLTACGGRVSYGIFKIYWIGWPRTKNHKKCENSILSGCYLSSSKSGGQGKTANMTHQLLSWKKKIWLFLIHCKYI